MSDIRSLAFTPTPGQRARLTEMLDLARQRGAAQQSILDHAAAHLEAHGPELSRRLAPDPRLDAIVAAEPKRSVVSEAADLLDRLSAAVEPADRDAFDASLASTILVRCEVLAARAKALLQS